VAGTSPVELAVFVKGAMEGITLTNQAYILAMQCARDADVGVLVCGVHRSMSQTRSSARGLGLTGLLGKQGSHARWQYDSAGPHVSDQNKRKGEENGVGHAG
jgi:hypothetical protein